jgi:hypothetical protein
MNTNEHAHAAVPATHRVLQNEQPGKVRHSQFRCAKCRRGTMDAFQCQAPALGKETDDPAGKNGGQIRCRNAMHVCSDSKLAQGGIQFDWKPAEGSGSV